MPGRLYWQDRINELTAELAETKRYRDELAESQGAGWAEVGRLWAFIQSRGLVDEAAEFLRRDGAGDPVTSRTETPPSFALPTAADLYDAMLAEEGTPGGTLTLETWIRAITHRARGDGYITDHVFAPNRPGREIANAGDDAECRVCGHHEDRHARRPWTGVPADYGDPRSNR